MGRRYRRWWQVLVLVLLRCRRQQRCGNSSGGSVCCGGHSLNIVLDRSRGLRSIIATAADLLQQQARAQVACAPTAPMEEIVLPTTGIHGTAPPMLLQLALCMGAHIRASVSARGRGWRGAMLANAVTVAADTIAAVGRSLR